MREGMLTRIRTDGISSKLGRLLLAEMETLTEYVQTYTSLP